MCLGRDRNGWGGEGAVSARNGDIIYSSFFFFKVYIPCHSPLLSLMIYNYIAANDF